MRATGVNPSRSRIGRDIWPAWVTTHGRASQLRLAGPGADEGPIRAASTGGREGRAAEEDQPERGVRGVSGCDRLSVDEGKERRSGCALRAKSASACARSTSSGVPPNASC